MSDLKHKNKTHAIFHKWVNTILKKKNIKYLTITKNIYFEVINK
jgi:hypothetical protein